MKTIKERELVITKNYHIVFTFDEDGSGYAFPADSQGKVLLSEMEQPAIDNYNYCMANPEKFPIEWNEFQMYESRYMEPALVECSCGEQFYLTNEYMGAASCPKCGSWYNMFGQSLVHPRYWED